MDPQERRMGDVTSRQTIRVIHSDLDMGDLLPPLGRDEGGYEYIVADPKLAKSLLTGNSSENSMI